MSFSWHPASMDELDTLWNNNIRANPDDPRWIGWKAEYIGYNRSGMARTYVITHRSVPVGEVTLLLDPQCAAVRGRECLADGKAVANINALRIQKCFEGRGLVSTLMKLVEQDAKAMGIAKLTIGVEAREARNLGIYLHWGYQEFILSQEEDGVLVLYYGKTLTGTP